MDNNNKIPAELQEEIKKEAQAYNMAAGWVTPLVAYRRGATEYAIWKVRYDELKAENETLKQQVTNLHEKKKRGAEEHRKLFLEHAALKDRAQGLVDAFTKLSESVQQLFDVRKEKGSTNTVKDAWNDVANKLWDANTSLQSWNQGKEGGV